MKPFGSVYYGWWIVVAGSMIMALVAGPYFHGVGTFVAALDNEFGWGRTLLAGAFSFSRLEGSILGPVSGYLADKLRPARMVPAGFCVMGVGYFLLSQVDGPVFFYAAFITIAVGGGMGGFIPCMAAVNHWFVKRRATAMALVMAGSSVGGLLVPLLGWGITSYGWRVTSLGIAGVMLMVALPFSTMLRRRPPEVAVVGTASQDPDASSAQSGDDSPTQAQQDDSTTQAQEEGFTGRQALKTRAFWLLALAHTSANMSIVVISVHGVPHLTDAGMSLPLAGTVVAIYTATSFAFQIIGGFVGDRINKRYAIWAFISLQGLSMLIFAFTSSFMVGAVFGVLYGIGFGGRGPILNALRADYFGRRAFGTVLGFSSVPLNVGMVASPLVLGFLFDIQGTYRYGMIGLGLIAIVGAVAALFATQPSLGRTSPGPRTSQA